MRHSNSFLNSILCIIIVTFLGISSSKTGNRSMQNPENHSAINRESDTLETVTLGAGCFWCVEAIFQNLEGVYSVVSGYSGGTVKNPTYEDVCTGKTGHAEVAQIKYDPRMLSFDELLEVYWSSHDPTTLNRQGSDVGTQYRSVIFYHNPRQKELAEKYKKKLNSEHAFENPVITEISAIKEFYKAENYHQNYFNENPNKPYCQFVIRPKLEKFEKIFKNKIKKKH
ncbi:MAG: peptide-methionine (S)-S-oxide reductase MsrA [Ignavibacteriales bacterium]|nr:peptide-methionine (S)-S-oxide reductase MsrA [Ignavibacteriales bacterium]